MPSVKSIQSGWLGYARWREGKHLLCCVRIRQAARYALLPACAPAHLAELVLRRLSARERGGGGRPGPLLLIVMLPMLKLLTTCSSHRGWSRPSSSSGSPEGASA